VDAKGSPKKMKQKPTMTAARCFCESFMMHIL
jgi:hypothetical protein